MNTKPKKRLNIWWAWSYERQQEHLEVLSKQGVHLVNPGVFRGSFETNPDVRFAYRIDYQPSMRKNKELNGYLSLYQDAGWEFVGEVQGWYHFRQPWTSEQVQPELYTDTDSLRQHYRRIQRLLMIVLLAELIVLVVNINNFAMLGHKGEDTTYVYILLCVLLAVLMVLLGYGCVALQKKISQLSQS